jgi:hypothetical protein
MHQYNLFIDGASRPPASGAWFDSDNPYTGEPWARIARGNRDDVDAAVNAAHRAFHTGLWSELTASERGATLRRLGDVLADNAIRLAELETRDNGKPYFVEFDGHTDIPTVEGAVLRENGSYDDYPSEVAEWHAKVARAVLAALDSAAARERLAADDELWAGPDPRLVSRRAVA